MAFSNTYKGGKWNNYVKGYVKDGKVIHKGAKDSSGNDYSSGSSSNRTSTTKRTTSSSDQSLINAGNALFNRGTNNSTGSSNNSSNNRSSNNRSSNNRSSNNRSSNNRSNNSFPNYSSTNDFNSHTTVSNPTSSMSWQQKLEHYKNNRQSAQREVIRAKEMYEAEQKNGASSDRLRQIRNWADQVRSSAGLDSDKYGASTANFEQAKDTYVSTNRNKYGYSPDGYGHMQVNDKPVGWGKALATNPLQEVNDGYGGRQDHIMRAIQSEREGVDPNEAWQPYRNFSAEQSPMHFEIDANGNAQYNKTYYGNLLSSRHRALKEAIQSGDQKEIQKWQSIFDETVQDLNNAPGVMPYLAQINSNAQLASKYGVAEASREWFDSEWNNPLVLSEGITERRHWSANPYYEDNPNALSRAIDAGGRYGTDVNNVNRSENLPSWYNALTGAQGGNKEGSRTNQPINYAPSLGRPSTPTSGSAGGNAGSGQIGIGDFMRDQVKNSQPVGNTQGQSGGNAQGQPNPEGFVGIDDFAKRFGFDYSKEYAQNQAETIEQQKRDGLNDSLRRVESDVQGAVQNMDHNYFLQGLRQNQGQVNRGLNGGIEADQDLRLAMNRQNAMGDIYRGANNTNSRIYDELARLSAEATAYANNLYDERRQHGYQNTMGFNNYLNAEDQRAFDNNMTDKRFVSGEDQRYFNNNLTLRDYYNREDQRSFDNNMMSSQQRFDNSMAYTNLLEDTRRWDNNFALTEGELTGNYIPQNARGLIESLLGKKQQAEASTNVSQYRAEADAIRNKLASMGMNVDALSNTMSYDSALSAISRMNPTLAGDQQRFNQGVTSAEMTGMWTDPRADQLIQQLAELKRTAETYGVTDQIKGQADRIRTQLNNYGIDANNLMGSGVSYNQMMQNLSRLPRETLANTQFARELELEDKMSQREVQIQELKTDMDNAELLFKAWKEKNNYTESDAESISKQNTDATIADLAGMTREQALNYITDPENRDYMIQNGVDIPEVMNQLGLDNILKESNSSIGSSWTDEATSGK